MKKKPLKKMHFTAPGLLQPTNPVRVNLVGCGGTGSRVLWELARTNHALLSFGHPGLCVYVFDADTVSHANVGRGFLKGEVGLHKASILVSNVNRGHGTDWKAFDIPYGSETLYEIGHRALAAITISCVDKVTPRFQITEILKAVHQQAERHVNRPRYLLDFGNSVHTGQAMLSTVGPLDQPVSRKYAPVPELPFLTDEYGELLSESEEKDDAPSCSLPEALSKQDLFVNPALATLGTSLLWKLFRHGMTDVRGFFMNLSSFRVQPVPVA